MATTAIALAVVAVVAVMGAGAAVMRQSPADEVQVTAASEPNAGGREQLAASIATAQTHLKLQPKDSEAWAGLALAYVARARLSADPTWYPKAEAAVARSFDAKPTGNASAEGADGALKVARHDFAGALASADRALALSPYSSQALHVRTDALVELGRYEQAQAAATLADDRHPGTPAATRLSYLAELRGDIPEAIRLMDLGAQDAGDASDVAFAKTQLGQLARTSGDLDAAETHFAAALVADPAYLPARAATASLLAAQGDTDKALAAYADVTARLPLPEYLTAYGELLESVGRTAEAEQQYEVLRASVALAAGNGVISDLELAHFEADHGSATQALAAAKSEWARRRSILAADAMAWALHASGRDKQALPFARAATRLGTKDPRLLYHRGMIELELGDRAAARASLKAALAIDPEFSPYSAPRARKALASLGSA